MTKSKTVHGQDLSQHLVQNCTKCYHIYKPSSRNAQITLRNKEKWSKSLSPEFVMSLFSCTITLSSWLYNAHCHVYRAHTHCQAYSIHTHCHANNAHTHYHVCSAHMHCHVYSVHEYTLPCEQCLYALPCVQCSYTFLLLSIMCLLHPRPKCGVLWEIWHHDAGQRSLRRHLCLQHSCGL